MAALWIVLSPHRSQGRISMGQRAFLCVLKGFLWVNFYTVQKQACFGFSVLISGSDQGPFDVESACSPHI